MDVNSSGTGWSLDRPAPRAYGEDFARHIEAFDPTFCKVLVRPEGDRALNKRQAARLKRLSDFAAVAASCSSSWFRRRRSSSTGSGATRKPTIVNCSPPVSSALYERFGARRGGFRGQTGKPSVTLDDIRHFRQLDSKAPGHPEYHWVSGVETTTGPLGQGIATSVGMAIGRKWLASRYNKPGFDIFDYNIYAICGDGCLMEGVGSEAASLAGHLRLDDLCWIYDNNHITIEGKTSITFTEDVAARFLAYRWNVLRVGDANDLQRIQDALAIFRKTKDRPTLIILDSHIGYGSPHKVDSAEAHGEPLGEEEVRLVKRAYHWPEDAKCRRGH
jgi:Transketolase, thiamine diphosphate binding domain